MKIWSQASQMALKTPAERNRYVDLLRSISILAVIIGHWLIATVYVVDGEMDPGHLLSEQPQMQWLTWLFQVMPIFFIVGGYSNAVSLESAERKGMGYAGWLYARLNRLVAPLLVLLVIWAGIALIMMLMNVDSGSVSGSHRSQFMPRALCSPTSRSSRPTCAGSAGPIISGSGWRCIISVLPGATTGWAGSRND